MNEIAEMYGQLSPENREKVEAETARLLARQNDPLSLARTERHPLPSEEVYEFAYKVLLDSGVRRFPVDVIGLCRKYGVRVKHVPKDKRHLLRGHEGSVTEAIDGVPYILVDESMAKCEQRFAVACGLGHFLLGHIPGTERCNGRSANLLHGGKELEASAFAEALLAPNCALELYGLPRDKDGHGGIPLDHEEMIEALCRVGHTVSRMKYYTYNIWRAKIERGEINRSKNEKKLSRRFWLSAFLYRVNHGKGKAARV